MKLLIVTCLKEYQQITAKIFEQAGITVFSVSETVGFKGNDGGNPMDSWFSAGREHFNSVFLFSFTTSEGAESAMKGILAYNTENKTGFPIRAFIVPVEKASYKL